MSKFKVGDNVVFNIDFVGKFEVIETNGTRVMIIKEGKSIWFTEYSFSLAAEDTSKSETVTHEGNVYQIGQCYLFSDDGVHWHSDNLERIAEDDDFEFKCTSCNWKNCKSFTSAEIGTITPAPIELIDGNAYMFDFGVTGNRIGVYSNSSGKFIYPAGYTSAVNCTNIRPMTVSESK